MSNGNYNRYDKRLVRFSDGRVVGWIEKDTFIRPVVGSRHQLRQPPAWAVDIEILLNAEFQGASMVEIRDSESRRTYFATIGLIWRNGFVFNRGHSEQIGLPLHLWKVKRNGNGCRQLRLWDDS
jgi:hypothetical protein